MTENQTPGWDAITMSLSKIYANQEPQHYAPVVYHSLGGSEPLDGISIYVNEKEKCYHYITYGFSELYEKETDNPAVSGFGYELTFRLKYNELESTYPIWPVNLLQNIAKMVFSEGIRFDEYNTLPTGPIKLDADTKIIALLFVIDPELSKISTPHGSLKFLEIFGLKEDEYEGIKNKTIDRREFIKQQQLQNRLLITDLDRK